MEHERASAEAFLHEGRSRAEPGASGEDTFARRPIEARGPQEPPRGQELAEPASSIEPPSVPDGTFVKIAPEDHPLARACEVSVYFQDYHRSSSKLGRFGKIVGIDVAGGEYLVMLDNFECVAVPMRRVEWRKVAT